MRQLRSKINESTIFAVQSLLQCRIYLGNAGFHLFSWQDAHHAEFCTGLTLANRFYDPADSLYDFVVGIEQEIVGAYQQENVLCRKTVQLTVVDTPQYIFCFVPAKSEITDSLSFEKFIPGFCSKLIVCNRFASPEMRDRVADHHHFGSIFAYLVSRSLRGVRTSRMDLFAACKGYMK